MTTAAPTGIYPNFVLDADADDTVIIAGMVNPGIARVKNEKTHEWDKKKGKGTSGATVTYTGSNLQEFEIEFYLWLPEHFDAWPAFAEALAKSVPVSTPSAKPATTTTAGGTGSSQVIGFTLPKTTTTPAKTAATNTAPSPQPAALDIYHPSLAEPPHKITRCIVVVAGGKKPDGKGGATYTYKFNEYSPPKPSGGTATGSKDATGGNSPEKPAEPTATTQAEKELADLLKKAQAL